ncbi:MAG: hypothetical protein KH028_00030 [Oscillospiraceae bacterium]|nr:hypothetical protein [Oscillospiraceae bacterium]
MTRQHIRFSALRSIFWGTLLLFLDFDLNFRFGFSFTVPLLPDCLGFWLVGRGTRALAADRPSLGLLAPFWLALGLWSLQQFFPGLSPHIPGALSLLAALFYFQDLLLRAPWLTVAAGAAGFCARVYILLRLWQLSRSMAPAPEASR